MRDGDKNAIFMDHSIDKKVPEIRSVYKPTGKEEEMLRRVYKRKLQMEDGTDYKKASSNWDKWRKQWEAERTAPDEEWQSNHIVPLTTSVVQAALAEMVDQTPQSFILAYGSEDVPKATFFHHIWDYAWETSRSDVAVADVIQESLICGTGLGQEYYLRVPRVVRSLVRGKDGELGEKEETIYDYDDVVLEPVKLEEFRVDENARGFTGTYGARDCMRRYIQDIEDVKSYFKQPGWDGLAKNLEHLKPGGNLDYYEFYKPPAGIDRSRQLEVWWYWSKFPDDWLSVVANDVVIYMGPNIYKHKQLPFGRAVDVKRTHFFYGKGEPDLLESTQDEKNTMRRMIIDRNHLDIDKMFLIGNRTQLAEEDLIARPHALIPVDDVSQVKAVEYGDVPRSTELSLKQLDEDGIIVTGIDPRLATNPSETATASAIAKETALKRIRMKLRILEREFLVEIGKLRMENILQFYTKPRLELIVGEKGTANYDAAVQKLQGQGLLVQIGSENYKEGYRNIRLKNKELFTDAKGVVQEKPIKDYSFFEAKPEFFVPASKEGFDIKFKAGSTLPVSKPLMQTKAAEMYDRLVQNPGFDPIKLGDMLLDVNDYQSEDYHVEQQVQGQESEQRLQQQIQLAMDENKMMVSGQELPPTEYASPAHSRIHIEFLRSQEVPSDQATIQRFSDHILGELLAQEQRQGAGMMGEQAMAGGPNGGQAPSSLMTAVQSGEGLRKGISSKSPKPLAMQDLVPGRITGGNNLPVQA